jgi:hypothetical protein
MRTIKILNKEFGILLDEVYSDEVQFKIFLDQIHSSLVMKKPLSYYNGNDCIVHIPYLILKESVIIGNNQKITLAEFAKEKSKMEKV